MKISILFCHLSGLSLLLLWNSVLQKKKVISNTWSYPDHKSSSFRCHLGKRGFSLRRRAGPCSLWWVISSTCHTLTIEIMDEIVRLASLLNNPRSSFDWALI